MTHDEVVEELPSMLTGELGRSPLLEVLAHLRGCADCRAELVDVAGAHGALAAARHTLTEARPAGLVGDAAEAGAGVSVLSLPPLGRRAGRGGPRRGLLVGVAAAVVVALALAGVALGDRWPFGGGSATATRQAVLAPVSAPSSGAAVTGASGVVRMTRPGTRTDMTIRTRGLPPAAAGHFYYAWLLDPTTNKMLPLGVVSADASSTFEVQSELVGRYSAIDISLQADDGNPTHSPVSVLRATYA